MKLTSFLSPEMIQYGAFLSSKKRVLERIGELVADRLNNGEGLAGDEQRLCPVECFTGLFKREKLGSTAINNGVALPHAKLPPNACLTLNEPIAVFLRLETAIDYDAGDNKNVDLVYALLFPEQCCESYKQGLSHIAQKLSDKTLLKHLRSAQSAEEIWQLLAQADTDSIETETDEQLSA